MSREGRRKLVSLVAEVVRLRGNCHSARILTNSATEFLAAICIALATCAVLVATEAQAAKPEAKPEKKESVEAKEPESTAKPEKTRTITFDTIKFEMAKEDPFDRELIGPKIEALGGKKIRIRGFVHPSSSFSQTMKKFVLVRDNLECCFGPGAALYDCIIVTMKMGKTAEYTTRPVSVEGTFRIEELADPIDPDANPQAIYQMEAEVVE